MKRPLPVFAVLLIACATHNPPAPPAPREATDVRASAARTWDAVIDLFAERNIPIRTIERASGIVATGQLTVGPEGRKWADCGTQPSDTLRPNAAIYNVLVRGDSISSKVKATVRWTRIESPEKSLECSTADLWERDFETEVRAHAEDPRAVYRIVSAPTEGATPVAAPHPGPAQAGGGASSSTAPAPHPAAADTTLGPTASRSNARSNNELVAYPAFGRAIGDMQRKRLILGYREPAWSRLELELSATAFNEPTLEYLLTRVFLGYSETMGGNEDTRLLVRAGGRVVGVYSRRGLQWL
jgi:hypothetical protein